ncbi:MAG: MerR family transcriptional regulator [Acetobacterium sp. MES1]|uniref:MerR family transcriptional regulator n=1 Tax=Acetobacterium sp. MES1 TaxID=1899015 RepID=UPI000B9CC295|nr:MerR family transcriptional regulator [Acetobacterium sp. MES1]OXS25033.1 MAG: MerR family transcriptional regulator [Acetobacterium sp. MES1]
MNETYQCQRVETVYYKIGLFSKINRVTIKALRHYDEIGLLPPAFIEEATGYRYYTSAQLPVLHQILALRDMGFTLDEIKQVQGGVPEKELLQKKRLEIIQKIAADTLRLAQVESYLAKKDGDTCDYHIILKDLPEVIVASMRTVIPSYDALFDVMPPMGAEMERLGCVCAVPEYCFNIYHDGEYRDTDVDVEICEAVTEKKADSEMLTFKVINRVEHAACVLHKGPYEGFPKAYNAMLKWAENNGYEIIDNPRESYIDGIWNKDSAEDWLTEIQFPVRKIS